MARPGATLRSLPSLPPAYPIRLIERGRPGPTGLSVMGADLGYLCAAADVAARLTPPDSAWCAVDPGPPMWPRRHRQPAECTLSGHAL